MNFNFDNLSKYYNIIKKYQDQCPVDIISMARELDLELYNINTSENISGAILKDNNRYIIYVKSSDSNNRKRFTIAHEISHFLLHKDIIDKNSITDNAMYRSNLSNTYERQANKLASEILIPIKKLRELLFKRYIRNINELANIFEVSKESMEIRLKEGGNMFLEE